MLGVAPIASTSAPNGASVGATISPTTTSPVCRPTRAARCCTPSSVRQWRHRPGDRQGGAYRVGRVVLVGRGIAEVGQDAVAEVLRHGPVVRGDDVQAALLVAPDDPPHVLRVQPGRQGGRADQVAEHDGEVAPLTRAFCRGRRLRDRAAPILPQGLSARLAEEVGRPGSGGRIRRREAGAVSRNPRRTRRPGSACVRTPNTTQAHPSWPFPEASGARDPRLRLRRTLVVRRDTSESPWEPAPTPARPFLWTPAPW